MSRFPRRPFALVAVVVLVLGLAACTDTPASSVSSGATDSAEASASASADATSSQSATESGEAAEERVALDGSQFEPAEMTIATGTEVVFENLDDFAHTVTEGTGGHAVEDPIVDEEIDAGDEVRVTFDEPGTYDITCAIHPTMQMTIVVED